MADKCTQSSAGPRFVWLVGLCFGIDRIKDNVFSVLTDENPPKHEINIVPHTVSGEIASMVDVATTFTQWNVADTFWSKQFIWISTAAELNAYNNSDYNGRNE